MARPLRSSAYPYNDYRSGPARGRTYIIELTRTPDGYVFEIPALEVNGFVQHRDELLTAARNYILLLAHRKLGDEDAWAADLEVRMK